MNLIFDVGNTSTKIAVFDRKKKVLSLRTKLYHWDKLQAICAPYEQSIDRAIVSSVRDIPDFIVDLATLGIPYVHVLSYKSELPFKIEYETPETLGPDRIAAVAGAFYLFPGKKILIIDAGSAVTYEYLSGRTYKGGNISPGLSMRFRALHRFTGKLPLASTTHTITSPGKSTFQAITAGVIKGLIYEINEYIRTFEKSHSDFKVILTGGDSGYLKDKIGYHVTYLPDIVLDGLNYILDYNAK
ncbi:MAG: type III pantothenate kinase [Bacteroidales bacterium]|nr:type III pantothenate kinase [Bacteroidales bacterium]